MKWYTHAAVGANTAWLSVIFGSANESTLLLVVAGSFAALIPDIDATSAKIHYLAGGVLGVFKDKRSGIFQHRGIWHSIFATLVVFVLSFVFLRDINEWLPLVIALAYFSHPLIDALNTSVGFLFPFYNKRINIVPRILRSNVGGPVDTALFIAACTTLFMLLLGTAAVIINQTL